MKPFAYIRARGEAEASRLSSEAGSLLLGGGTDVLPLLKSWLLPEGVGDRLVSLRDVPDLSGIREEEDGSLWIGGATTLASVLGSELLQARAPILCESVRDAATPQLRNVATVAGNLLQTSRCPYFRTPDLFDDCYLKGGEGCPAATGDSTWAGIFSSGTCRSAHPSDLAPALLALGAEIEVRLGDETSVLPLHELYRDPTPDRRREHTLVPGSLVRGIRVPAGSNGGAQAYRKGLERETWSFALASVAVCLQIEAGVVAAAEIWLGGVAPIPHRAEAAAAALEGARLSDESSEAAARAMGSGADPLPHNRYKLGLLRGLLRDALSGLAQG